MKKVFKKNVYVNKMTRKDLKALVELLNSKKIKGSIKSKNTVNERLEYTYLDTVITLYKTGTIMIQGKNVIKLVDNLKLPYIEFEKEKVETKQTKTKAIKKDKKTIIPNEYFGCDEVGVGDYFGGIVCACVYTNPQITKRLIALGVEDSKNIKDDKQIAELAKQIMNTTIFNVAEFTPAQYNDYYKSYPNANKIKAICHNTNIMQMQIEHIEQTNKHLTVVMDQFCPPQTYVNHLESLGHGYTSLVQGVDIFETKAETKYIAVAAASILARHFFIQEIKSLEKIIYDKTKQKIKIPLGASNKSEIKKVIDLITKNFGKTNLRYFIKTNFKGI